MAWWPFFHDALDAGQAPWKILKAHPLLTGLSKFAPATGNRSGSLEEVNHKQRQNLDPIYYCRELRELCDVTILLMDTIVEGKEKLLLPETRELIADTSLEKEAEILHRYRAQPLVETIWEAMVNLQKTLVGTPKLPRRIAGQSPQTLASQVALVWDWCEKVDGPTEKNPVTEEKVREVLEETLVETRSQKLPPPAAQSPSGPWANSEDMPPSGFIAGPLSGQKKQLYRWIIPHGVDTKSCRALDTKLRDGEIWGRIDDTRCRSVWFKTQQRFSECNRRKLDDESGD